MNCDDGKSERDCDELDCGGFNLKVNLGRSWERDECPRLLSDKLGIFKILAVDISKICQLT